MNCLAHAARSAAAAGDRERHCEFPDALVSVTGIRIAAAR